MLEVHQLEKPDPREKKKFTMVETQGKTCPRCMLQENPTHIKRNSS